MLEEKKGVRKDSRVESNGRTKDVNNSEEESKKKKSPWFSSPPPCRETPNRKETISGRSGRDLHRDCEMSYPISS